MALTESNMLPLGTEAPDFQLPDTLSGKTLSLQDLRGPKGLVVMFLCNHCPYVVHVNPELIRLAEEYEDLGIGFVGISSNDVERYPQDGPEAMKQLGLELGYPFPYLYDESQAVARAYDAACTPDFYLFDENLYLVYRGQLDDARPGKETPLNGYALRAALDALLKGSPMPQPQRPSAGCNIKWKS